MKDRKLCGYDLNGWVDRAARNWVLEADGEERSVEAHITGRVLRPSIVQVGDAAAKTGHRWIGGEQASLAPHGRGGGWGKVGDHARRRLVTTLLAEVSTPKGQLSAALTGLASGSKVSVVAIAEGPETTESLQERLVEALAAARLGRGLMVWRSVLAVLATEGLAEDAVIGVIGHVAGGFTLQRLRLRSVMTPKGPVIAPERKQAAVFVASDWGYAGLWASARQAAHLEGRVRGQDWAIHSRAIAEAALTGEARSEIIHSEGQDFHLITPSAPSLKAQSTDARLTGCDLVLFETLTEGPLRQELAEAVMQLFDTQLTACPPEAVAIGALEAARRHAQGLPVFFDFLPQISTIVLGADGAENYDLIEADEALPAGHVYRSPRPAHFMIQAGQSTVSVYIRKELAPWPRKASIDIGTILHAPVPVNLRVEQTPAAGRARLIVEAPSLSRHFTLDWESAEEIQRPWDDLIAELGIMEATIPARMVLPCGMLSWLNPDNGDGLLEEVRANIRRASPDWKGLAARLSGRIKRTSAISSDGEIPQDVPLDSIADLDTLTSRAMAIVRAQAAGVPPPDNEPLRVLTWQFRRAPAEVTELLLAAIGAHCQGRSHPFALHQASWTLVYQGFGRTCRDPDLEAQALRFILARPVASWNFRRETATLAFLLSRSDTAPFNLDRAAVEKIGARIRTEFAEAIGTKYTKFLYAPFLLGGLLRWRLKHRSALVVGTDPLADKFKTALAATQADLTRRSRRDPAMQAVDDRYSPLLVQLTDELEGHGGNPDLLISLYDASKGQAPPVKDEEDLT